MKPRDILITLAVLLPTIALSAIMVVFRDHLKDLAGLGYAGAFALAFIGNAVVFVPFPWIIPVAAMGAIYAPVPVLLCAAVGAACGGVLPYAAGARLSHGSRSSWLVTRLNGLAGPRKTLVVFALALSPVFSYPGLASGVLRYPLWATFAITLVAEGGKLWLATNAVIWGSHIGAWL